ncbi:MAG: hypothetical protein AB7G51_13805 [Steroidobacteraceae bacterium]
MADAIDVYPAVVAASSTPDTVALNPMVAYSIAHDAEDASGTPDENTIYLSFSDTVDADSSAGTNKAKLLAGRAMPIRRGVKQIRFASAAGAPTFTVVPITD